MSDIGGSGNEAGERGVSMGDIELTEAEKHALWEQRLENARQRLAFKDGVDEETLLIDAKECGCSSVEEYWERYVLRLPPLLASYAENPWGEI